MWLSDSVYQRCFEAYMSMHCSSAFPKCSTIQVGYLTWNCHFVIRAMILKYQRLEKFQCVSPFVSTFWFSVPGSPWMTFKDHVMKCRYPLCAHWLYTLERTHYPHSQRHLMIATAIQRNAQNTTLNLIWPGEAHYRHYWQSERFRYILRVEIPYLVSFFKLNDSFLN